MLVGKIREFFHNCFIIIAHFHPEWLLGFSSLTVGLGGIVIATISFAIHVVFNF